MRESPLNSPRFPTARCEPCGKTVLTHVAFSEGGDASRLCIHCDATIEADLSWVTAEELAMEGYDVGSPRAKAAGGSCGTACGSCSTRGH